MYYIVFDLEWNNAYNYATGGFMNEIIEVGAIKLDEKLNIVDTFKQLIKPAITKKLSSRCRRLTNITSEELREHGLPFDRVMSDFARWSEGDNSVFLSWSNTDLYVLAANFLQYTTSCNVPFIHRYCDAQRLCMSFIESEDKNQISLQRCAELFEIDVDTSKLHRALADCHVTVECMRKIFDRDKFDELTRECDADFFGRMIFKPYLITKLVSEDFNAYEYKIYCPECNGKLRRLKDFDVINKSFRCPTKCTKCRKSFWTTIRAKKTYDGVSVYVRSVEMNRKKARRISR